MSIIYSVGVCAGATSIIFYILRFKVYNVTKVSKETVLCSQFVYNFELKYEFLCYFSFEKIVKKLHALTCVSP